MIYLQWRMPFAANRSHKVTCTTETGRRGRRNLQVGLIMYLVLPPAFASSSGCDALNRGELSMSFRTIIDVDCGLN